MKTIHISLFCLLLSISTAVSADALLDEARKLIESNQSGQALTLLAPYNDERAGDPDFDTLLGLAALNAGHYTEAVFALERVLAIQPDNTKARYGIARAYREMNETRRAKGAFEQVLASSDIPQDVATLSKNYLNAITIAEKKEGEKTTVKYFAELTLGQDSNANGGPTDNTLTVPSLPGFIVTLDPTSVETSASFATGRVGVAINHTWRKDIDLFLNAKLVQRNNDDDADQFDTGSLDGNGGLRITDGDNTYTAALVAENFQLDNDSYRDMLGISGQWAHKLNTTSRFTVYGQAMDLDYPGQRIRDSNRYVLGANYSKLFPSKQNPILYIGAYVGEEDERASGVPHLGHDFHGIKMGGQMKLTHNAIGFASLTLEERRYGGQDPLFLRKRKDHLYGIRVGSKIVPAKSWSITPEIITGDVGSTIETSETDRTVLSLTIRKDFE